MSLQLSITTSAVVFARRYIYDNQPDTRFTEPPAMKKGIHPEYRPVVFMDAAANFSFLTRSTVQTNDTITWTDGKEYPLYKLEISSASHPYFTGKMKFVDTTGRVEKFQKKYQRSAYGKSRKAAEDKSGEKQ
jgi:large subunit ribosomal protein L31